MSNALAETLTSRVSIHLFQEVTVRQYILYIFVAELNGACPKI